MQVTLVHILKPASGIRPCVANAEEVQRLCIVVNGVVQNLRRTVDVKAAAWHGDGRRLVLRHVETTETRIVLEVLYGADHAVIHAPSELVKL